MLVRRNRAVLQATEAVHLKMALCNRVGLGVPSTAPGPVTSTGAHHHSPPVSWTASDRRERERDRQSSRRYRTECSSDLVINVCWTLRGHLLNYVHWMSIVATDFFIVRAKYTICSPQGNDNVTGFRPVVVPTAFRGG